MIFQGSYESPYAGTETSPQHGWGVSGTLIASAETFEEASAILKASRPNPEKGEARLSYETPVERVFRVGTFYGDENYCDNVSSVEFFIVTI